MYKKGILSIKIVGRKPINILIILVIGATTLTTIKEIICLNHNIFIFKRLKS